MADHAGLAGEHRADASIVQSRVDASDSTVAFDSRLRNASRKCDDLLYRKHQDYGPYGIINAPGGPLVGVAVRLHDKVARLANLLEKGADAGYMADFESLSDTLKDIRNYGQIGYMILDKTWPGTEGP